MITKQEYNELVADVRMKEATQNLIKVFKDLDLTPTFDMNRIRDEYKVVLFQNLLKVDKGLKMRYEMLRTDEAKLKLVTDTVSLDGYTELDEIREALDIYEGALNSTCLYKLPITKTDVVAEFGCDLVKASEQFVVTQDLENNVAYQQLKQVEAIVNDMLKAGTLPSIWYRKPFDVFREILVTNPDTNTVAIDEVIAYQYLSQQ